MVKNNYIILKIIAIITIIFIFVIIVIIKEKILHFLTKQQAKLICKDIVSTKIIKNQGSLITTKIATNDSYSMHVLILYNNEYMGDCELKKRYKDNQINLLKLHVNYKNNVYLYDKLKLSLAIK